VCVIKGVFCYLLFFAAKRVLYFLGERSILAVIYRVSQKNAMEIQQAVVPVCCTSQTWLNNSILHRTKEQLFSSSMIPFLNHNDGKWPHTHQIKFFGRNHILSPLGIENTLIMQS
jgi:hypothetical protein